MIVDLNQVQAPMKNTDQLTWLGDVVQLNHDYEPWLYVLDADWSDLIEISDVTRTVYISFDAKLGTHMQ